jgi:hypothetical protein
MVADFDGDGLLDLGAMTSDSIGWTLAVLRGDGHGNFAAPFQTNLAGASLFDAQAADLNHDGKPDIVVGSDEAQVLLNTSN